MRKPRVRQWLRQEYREGEVQLNLAVGCHGRLKEGESCDNSPCADNMVSCRRLTSFEIAVRKEQGVLHDS